MTGDEYFACSLLETIVPYGIDVYLLRRYDKSTKFMRQVPITPSQADLTATGLAPIVKPETIVN